MRDVYAFRMSDRFVVLFECSPAENPAWVKEVCESLGLALIDNDEVAESMPEEARKLFLDAGVHGEDPRLAPYYRKALEKVAGDAKRIALQSTSWLIYGEKPAAVVVDFDPVLADAKSNAGGDAAEGATEYTEQVKQHWRARLAEHVAAASVLELPTGLSDAKKVGFARVHLSAAERSAR